MAELRGEIILADSSPAYTQLVLPFRLLEIDAVAVKRREGGALLCIPPVLPQEVLDAGNAEATGVFGPNSPATVHFRVNGQPSIAAAEMTDVILVDWAGDLHDLLRVISPPNGRRRQFISGDGTVAGWPYSYDVTDAADFWLGTQPGDRVEAYVTAQEELGEEAEEEEGAPAEGEAPILREPSAPSGTAAAGEAAAAAADGASVRRPGGAPRAPRRQAAAAGGGGRQTVASISSKLDALNSWLSSRWCWRG